MREHVVAAAHAMEKGNWKACRDFITSIKVGHMIYRCSHMTCVLYHTGVGPVPECRTCQGNADNVRIISIPVTKK